jgi:hypothetical protein
MTTLAPVARPPGPPAGLAEPRTGAVALLTIWLVLIFAIPARLTIESVATPATLLAVGLTGLWCTSRLCPGLSPPGAQPLRGALLAFGAVVIVGYLVGLRRVLAPVEAGAADRTVIAYGTAIGLALFIADAVATRAQLLTLIRRVVWAGVFLAALGTLHGVANIELASHLDPPLLEWDRELAVGIERTSFDRVLGTATHPIEYGVVLAMILPLSLHLAMTDFRHRRARWWMTSAFIGSAALFSLSRSAAIGLAITLVATAIALPKGASRQRFLAGLVVTLCVMRLIVPGLLGTVRGLFVGLSQDGSYQVRVADYDVVDVYLDESLWLGRGLGTFLPEKYVLLDNQMLKLLLEIGLVGAVAFVALLATGFLVGRTVRRHGADPMLRDLARSLQVVLVIAFASCFTFDFLGFPLARSMLFLALGLLGATWRIAGASAPGDGRPAVATLRDRTAA